MSSAPIQPKHLSRSRRKPGATDRARTLRKGENVAEAIMWNALKARRLGGYKFVRQFPLGPYFADFICREKRLVVEIDGSQHVDKTGDRVRDEYMRDAGYRVIRLWNTDVLNRQAAVCDTILLALAGQLADDVVASDLRFVLAMPKQ